MIQVNLPLHTSFKVSAKVTLLDCEMDFSHIFRPFRDEKSSRGSRSPPQRGWRAARGGGRAPSGPSVNVYGLAAKSSKDALAVICGRETTTTSLSPSARRHSGPTRSELRAV